MEIAWSQEQYLKALWFASEAHQGQKYPGTEHPYLIHLMMVVGEVMAIINTPEIKAPDLLIQCAILHDVIEDTAITFEQIEEVFGTDVAKGVQALSKDSVLPSKREQMEDSLKRILKEPREVWMVKLADRISNLRKPPAHWSYDKIKGYWIEAMVIFEALGAAHPILAHRLKGKMDHYKQLSRQYREG